MGKMDLKQTLDGWTILFDDITDKYGLVEAAVFGVVYRYCQMRDGYCHASVATLANEVHLGERTLQYHLKNLVLHGYLKCEIHKGTTTEYKDAGLIRMKSSMVAEITNGADRAPLDGADRAPLMVQTVHPNKTIEVRQKQRSIIVQSLPEVGVQVVYSVDVNEQLAKLRAKVGDAKVDSFLQWTDEKGLTLAHALNIAHKKGDLANWQAGDAEPVQELTGDLQHGWFNG